jgi:hypothetical protein
MGWYHSQLTGTSNSGAGEVKVLSKQKGVIRTNCMDCLDRTNVTQSALARWTLNKQFRAVGILSHKESIEDHEGFMAMFRNGESSLYHCEAIANNASMGRSRRHCLVRLRGYWSLEI